MDKSTRLNCILAPQSCPLGLAGDDDGGGGGDDDDDVDNDDDVDDKGGMLHCLDLIDSLGWLANLCFSKSVFLRLTLTFNSGKSLQNDDSEA